MIQHKAEEKNANLLYSFYEYYSLYINHIDYLRQKERPHRHCWKFKLWWILNFH